MHTDITLKTEKYGIFTIKYDGVQYVTYDTNKPNVVEIKLYEDYTAKGLKIEYQTSCIPYLHIYDCVIKVHISEK